MKRSILLLAVLSMFPFTVQCADAPITGARKDLGNLVTPVLNVSLDFGGHQANNLAEPTSNQDAATKNYVDSHSGASGANTALSNLASVNINAGLVPASSSLSLGQNGGNFWRHIYIDSIHANVSAGPGGPHGSLELGQGSTVTQSNSAAIGALCSVGAQNSMAGGLSSTVTGSRSLGWGQSVSIGGPSSIGVGANHSVTGAQSYTFGLGNIVAGNNSGALGHALDVEDDDQVAVGVQNIVDNTQRFIVGNGDLVTPSTAFSIDKATGNSNFYSHALINVPSVTGAGDLIMSANAGSDARVNGSIILLAATDHISANTVNITSVADPVNPQDAATKNYVDTHAGGGAPADSVIVVDGSSGLGYFDNIRLYSHVAKNTGTDITYVDAVSSGEDDSFVIHTEGNYDMSLTDVCAGACPTYFGFSLNAKGVGDPNGSGPDVRNTVGPGLPFGTMYLGFCVAGQANVPIGCSVTRHLHVNDVIRNHGTGTGGSGGNAIFTISRVN